MKKLLLVLLVVTLASFLFVGCLPVTPSEGEGEGEGEGEVAVTVEIEGAVVVDGKTYVSGGAHTPMLIKQSGLVQVALDGDLAAVLPMCG